MIRKHAQSHPCRAPGRLGTGTSAAPAPGRIGPHPHTRQCSRSLPLGHEREYEHPMAPLMVVRHGGWVPLRNSVEDPPDGEWGLFDRFRSYAAMPNSSAMKVACAIASSFATHLTLPFRIICTASIPCKVPPG